MNVNEPNLEAADQDAAGAPEPHVPEHAAQRKARTKEPGNG